MKKEDNADDNLYNVSINYFKLKLSKNNGILNLLMCKKYIMI